MRKGITYRQLFFQFILISFLLPRGYGEINSTYKTISSLLVWAATFFIYFDLLFAHKKNNKLTIQEKKEYKNIFTYFVVILIISFAKNGFGTAGLQKILSYPAIFAFSIKALKNDAKLFLNSICNVLLVFLIFNAFADITFFSDQYHLTFLGHVQMISQYCVLSIFSAALYLMTYKEKKYRTLIIILVSLYTLGVTDAAISIFSLAIAFFWWLTYKFKIYHILKINSKVYITLGLILSIGIIILSIRNNLYNNNALHYLDFNGRSFIWIAALDKIKIKWLLGYGIDGILLSVFWTVWTNKIGFNYTHNQILQNLLDGGIITLFLYWRMFYTCFNNTKQIKDDKYKILLNAALSIYLVIMILESTSMYCYMYIFLAIVYSITRIENIEGEN